MHTMFEREIEKRLKKIKIKGTNQDIAYSQPLIKLLLPIPLIYQGIT